ncbi:hypothetical protein [Nitrosomonas sp. Nm51]|uniref:hypothetical protein n=1 Tax=Nitrosomonas sp. Nm51 TaxID=133720 RepID=UPI000B809A6D|nr:hypothetical protein [Nitrosomonas sp. Nm51]
MYKLSIFAGAVAGVMIAGAAQNTFAHTRLNVPAATEGTRSINYVVIGHACGEDKRVLGTSVVFPNGLDSTILVDGAPHTGPVTDFLTNYGNNAQLLFDRSVFEASDEITDSNGNVVGFWAGGGAGVPNHLNALIPMRLTAARIEPTSCAQSVKVSVSIANICELTGVDGFGEGVVDLWTHNNIGSSYDRVSETDDGPASFTISRDVASNPLPENCGEGVAVEIRPSAAQLDRDMPIRINGQQVWPQP